MGLFRKLGITEPVIKSIEEQKFEKPSEIQEKSIPLILAGKDVIAGSATGSGKTLAFASAIIEHSQKIRRIQALVMTPTRELAEQVAKEIRKFAKHKPLEIVTVYGGVAIHPQMDKLRVADVVVGTPGRILDHINRRTVDFRNVKILVLDEADRMFDMGFIDDVEAIIRQCPQKRQTMLFSATITDDVAHIARRYMNNPVRVSAESQVDPKKLLQFYYDIPDNMKLSLLVHLLKTESTKLVMVFCNTQATTNFVAHNLKAQGINALATHGGLSQDKRTRTMEQFHSQEVTVLVCTDVAARGLDIKGVSHVYNYDIPRDSRQYIHRIGRTARAGKDGKAVSLLSQKDYENYDRVLRDNDVTIHKIERPQVERIETRQAERTHSGNYGRRPQGGGNFGRRGESREERSEARGNGPFHKRFSRPRR